MEKIISLNGIEHIFFIGIAGSGMSALAQFLAGSGKTISGSDRYFTGDGKNETQKSWKQKALNVIRKMDLA